MLGSKRPSLRPSAAVSRSPPARRRGSKLHAGPHPRDPPRSPPARRRGSKHGRGGGGGRHRPSPPARRRGLKQRPDRVDDHAAGEQGRASCRESVCQYGEITEEGVSIKTKSTTLIVSYQD